MPPHRVYVPSSYPGPCRSSPFAPTRRRSAIDELTADGTTVSDAVRTALREAVLRQAALRHAKQRLRDEVSSIAADPEDRRAAARVLRDTELLNAW